jgi:hypothetical protein
MPQSGHCHKSHSGRLGGPSLQLAQWRGCARPKPLLPTRLLKLVRTELVEQRFRFFQIGGVKPFGEPYPKRAEVVRPTCDRRVDASIFREGADRINTHVCVSFFLADIDNLVRPFSHLRFARSRVCEAQP